jgi:hypothetical protein
MFDSWKEFTLAHLVNFASGTSILLIFHHEIDYYYLYFICLEFGSWYLCRWMLPTRTSVLLFNFLFGGGGLFVVLFYGESNKTKSKIYYFYYDAMKSSLFEGKVMQKRGQSNQCMGQTLKNHSIRRDKVLPKKIDPHQERGNEKWGSSTKNKRVGHARNAADSNFLPCYVEMNDPFKKYPYL